VEEKKTKDNTMTVNFKISHAYWTNFIGKIKLNGEPLILFLWWSSALLETF